MIRDSHRTVAADRGFTLVELLVVIGIIAVLIGVLLPVLGRAREHAAMLRELSACRELLTAYSKYHQENRGSLIPGHIFDSKIRVYDNFGRVEVTGEQVQRWPWRLIGASRYTPKGSLIIGERADALSDPSLLSKTEYAVNYQYMVSLTPTFGLNFYGLGGDLSLSNGRWVPSTATRYCVRKANQVTQVSNRIVFASARGMGIEGVAEGYWKLVPPQGFPYEYGTAWSPDSFRAQKAPEAWGYVHPRWRGKAVVGFFDGHCEAMALNDMRDIRRWIEAAAKSGNPAWVPPS